MIDQEERTFWRKWWVLSIALLAMSLWGCAEKKPAKAYLPGAPPVLVLPIDCMRNVQGPNAACKDIGNDLVECNHVTALALCVKKANSITGR